MEDRFGKVVECKHCGGKGRCDCVNCLRSAGFDVNLGSYGHTKQTVKDAKCTACGGAGHVWVGPQHITVVNQR